ncbi:hypothetical protein [Methylobacterium oryzisoli]|uniref:hypothetical protein n=1 Tax=Methylobacterium oryzisoli TaxID=3385502 RepID=UPI0038926754
MRDELRAKRDTLARGVSTDETLANCFVQLASEAARNGDTEMELALREQGRIFRVQALKHWAQLGALIAKHPHLASGGDDLRAPRPS